MEWTLEGRLRNALAGLVTCLALLALPFPCGSGEGTGEVTQTDELNSPAAQDMADASSAEADQGTQASAEQDKKYYTVDCDQVDENGEKFCLVDKATYVGWRTFHAVCHVCHAQNAVGSTFAPSLLKHIDKDEFVKTVTYGRSGQIGVMPAWGKNPNVKDFIDELYAYQQARADGVLKPGRPKRMD